MSRRGDAASLHQRVTDGEFPPSEILERIAALRKRAHRFDAARWQAGYLVVELTHRDRLIVRFGMKGGLCPGFRSKRERKNATLRVRRAVAKCTSWSGNGLGWAAYLMILEPVTGAFDAGTGYAPMPSEL